jgi:hypothetical protein
MATKEVTIRVFYNVHIKVRGKWFDKEFLAKDDKRNELKLRRSDPESLTLPEARFIAGDDGIVWKITTVNELIVQEICNPD